MHCWHGRNNRKGHSIRVHCRRAHGIKQGAESNDPRKSIVAHSWAAHSDHPDISGRPLQRCPHATQRRLRAMLLSHSVHSIKCMQSRLEYIRHMASSLTLLAKNAWHGAGLRGSSFYTVPQRPVCYREGVEAACRSSPSRRPGCGPSNTPLWAVCRRSCRPPHSCSQTAVLLNPNGPSSA